MLVARIAAVSVVLTSCTSSDTETAPLPPVLPACSDPLALPLSDGSCVRPGIPPDGCAPGFVHDGEYGCEPILPEATCPPGLMAVPGESTCRAVMACGQGRWGDISVDASTKYVDGAYTGGQNDGSEAHPWTTISEAVAAAPAGALIAIAEGTYMESVVVDYTPVRLHGVCPEKVSIVGQGAVGSCPAAPLCIGFGAHGTEVRGVALSGVGVGVTMSGVEQVLVEQVYVHDTSGMGVAVEDALGPTSLTLRGSLVEQANDVGVLVLGSEALIDASVVRATQPRTADQKNGWGIDIQVACSASSSGQMCETERRANAIVRDSLIEQNRDVGLRIAGSSGQVEGSVVRETLLRESDQTGGWGIGVGMACAGTATGPTCDPRATADATITGSLVERSRGAALMVMGSTSVVDAFVARDTLPSGPTQPFGRGINVQDCDAEQGCAVSVRGLATITRSLVDRSHEAGVLVLGADTTMETSVVRVSKPRVSDQLDGAGVVVINSPAPADMTLSQNLIQDSAHAGVGNFGALVTLSATHIRCAAFALTGDPFNDQDFIFDDRGNNHCGCPTADGACKAEGAGLNPPEALDPSQ